MKNQAGISVYTGTDLASALKWATSQAGKTTYVPSGTYTISGTDSVCINTIASGVTLIGDGPAATIFNFVWTGGVAHSFEIKGWVFGFKGTNVNDVTLKNFGITGDGAILFHTTTGTTSNNKCENVTVFDTGNHNIAAFYALVSPNCIADSYKFYRCIAYNTGGDGFDMWGDTSGVSNNYCQNFYYEDCKALYCGYSTHRWDWTVGFDLGERCNGRYNTLNRCEASYSWESGFHFEDWTSGTGCVLNNCVANYNGQKYSDARGALFGWGYLLHGANIGTSTGTGNVRGLWSAGYSNLPYTEGSIDYTYKLSGSTVLNSAGGTAYTGSSVTDALQWACNHANAVVRVPAGTYSLTGTVTLASGVCLIGGWADFYGSVGEDTKFTFPSSGTSGFLLSASNARIQNVGINNGNVQITASSGTLSGIMLKGVRFYSTTASRPAAVIFTAASGAAISGTVLGNVHAMSSATLGYKTSCTITGMEVHLCTGTGTL